MFISKKNRLLVYSYLFKEGTCVVKQDYSILGNHSEELAVPNLEVLALMKSFTSKGFVKDTFNWRWHYCYLTEEGIAYLREYLCLPDDIVPATLKQPAGRQALPSGSRDDKKMSAGGFKPEYEGGGFGRGRRDGYRRE
jgi:small subunit ribosomal protein S10e